MFEPLLAPAAPALDEMSAADLLGHAREAQEAAWRHEATVLAAALQWAILHPSADGSQDAHDAACYVESGSVEPIAGDGCPGVAEFAVPEFGAVLGLSTTAAKKMLGHALELAHRLPRTWRRIQDGEVPAWRGRLVAEATVHASPALTVEAAAWVDAQVAPFLGKVGQAQIDRTVEHAVTLFSLAQPEPVLDPDDPSAGMVTDDHRHVTVHHTQVNSDGTVDVTAQVDLVDALDLDHALRCGAAELKTLGSQEPLGARRSRALGHLARHQLALDLLGARGIPTEDEAGDPSAAETSDAATGSAPLGDLDERLTGTAARRLDLHLHFDAMFAPDTGLCVSPLGRLEEGQRQLMLATAQAWMRDSHTEVRILPVIDLNADYTSEAYTPSPALRRQVELRDHTCVFPWCTRPARSSDLDHTIAYDHDHDREPDAADGPPQTRSSNLGALCRSHHRLKTHGGWHLDQPTPGIFEWTSPHQHRYRRDRHGTEPLAPADTTARPS